MTLCTSCVMLEGTEHVHLYHTCILPSFLSAMLGLGSGVGLALVIPKSVKCAYCPIYLCRCGMC